MLSKISSIKALDFYLFLASMVKRVMRAMTKLVVELFSCSRRSFLENPFKKRWNSRS